MTERKELAIWEEKRMFKKGPITATFIDEITYDMRNMEDGTDICTVMEVFRMSRKALCGKDHII